MSGTYLKNQARNEFGFWDMQHTFTTMAWRGFEMHCTLSTVQLLKNWQNWFLRYMLYLDYMWREHISKTRHMTKFVLEICDIRWWVKSTIWVREVRGFWDTCQVHMTKLVFELCVARLRQCEWSISQKTGYAHGHSLPASNCASRCERATSCCRWTSVLFSTIEYLIARKHKTRKLRYRKDVLAMHNPTIHTWFEARKSI